MALKPLNDMVMLREEKQERALIRLADDPNEKKLAEVVATGPKATQVKAGDRVLVNGGAGFRVQHEGEEYWFVYEERSDIVAVVEP